MNLDLLNPWCTKRLIRWSLSTKSILISCFRMELSHKRKSPIKNIPTNKHYFELTWLLKKTNSTWLTGRQDLGKLSTTQLHRSVVLRAPHLIRLNSKKSARRSAQSPRISIFTLNWRRSSRQDITLLKLESTSMLLLLKLWHLQVWCMRGMTSVSVARMLKEVLFHSATLCWTIKLMWNNTNQF